MNVYTTLWVLIVTYVRLAFTVTPLKETTMTANLVLVHYLCHLKIIHQSVLQLIRVKITSAPSVLIHLREINVNDAKMVGLVTLRF